MMEIWNPYQNQLYRIIRCIFLARLYHLAFTFVMNIAIIYEDLNRGKMYGDRILTMKNQHPQDVAPSVEAGKPDQKNINDVKENI